MDSKKNWRNEAGLDCTIFYKKKFAILPIKCSAGTIIWLKNYYSKYEKWYSKYNDKSEYAHIDFIENINEAEYIVRKLSETP